jgi:hypothetical protein
VVCPGTGGLTGGQPATGSVGEGYAVGSAGSVMAEIVAHPVETVGAGGAGTALTGDFPKFR